MLPPAAGVPVVRRELTGSGPGGEVVVAGALGVLLEERHATGGLDPERAGGAGPMTGRITAMTLAGLDVRTELDPDAAGLPRRPPHRRHAGAARRDGHGGVRRGGPRPARTAGRSSRSRTSSCWRRSSSTATSRARSSCTPWSATAATARSSPTASSSDAGRCPSSGERETRHFTGRARLSRAFGAAPQRRRSRQSAAAGRAVVGHAELYRVYFHGPAYQVLEQAWRENGHVIGPLAADLPPSTSRRCRRP